MRTIGYTIVAPNYLAHGLSLQESFLRHNPGCSFHVCVVARPEDLPEEDRAGLIFVSSIQDTRVPGMLEKYKVFEMVCALKPFFAHHLFHIFPEADHLVYFDSDILVFNRLASPPKAAITLTPHRMEHTGFLPESNVHSDFSLQRFGIFNAGYFEVTRSPEGLRFLEWWMQLLEDQCFFDPDKHQACDQLWLNCVPVFFEDLHINRHPGYNMAYWNLIERKLEAQPGGWTVNGEPLVFFHFSHYQIETPEKMSSFDSPFLSFSQFPELRPVYKAYEEGVIKHGYSHFKPIPYPYTVRERDVKKKGLLGKLFGKH